jgi:ATP-dependent DNA helicase RecQ
MPEASRTAGPNTVLLDIEATLDGQILHIGAVRGAGRYEKKAPMDVGRMLSELDHFAAGAKCIVGHNLVQYDLPLLQSLRPTLNVLKLPVIDTLLLSPLAFPENPYHALIKDYKLVKDSLNDPVADAQIAWGILLDEIDALKIISRNTGGRLPGLYRYCLTFSARSVAEQNAAAGFGFVFDALDIAAWDTHKALEQMMAVLDGVSCTVAAERLVRGLDERPNLQLLAYALAWLTVAGGNSMQCGHCARS